MQNKKMRSSRLTLFALLLIGLVSGCGATLEQGSTDTATKRPAHHTNDGFRNPYPVDNTKRSFFKYWWMRLVTEDFPDYEAVSHLVPRVKTDPKWLTQPATDSQLTWIGHATFLIQHRGVNIVTDPQFSDRASPFSFMGPKRLVPLPVTLEQLPKIDYVVLSHNHYDHMDEVSIKALGNTPMWLVPLKLKQTLIGWGIDKERIVELDWWQQSEQTKIKFTATPAHHFSARGLFDRNETLWTSWMIELEGLRIWFGGDTAYNPVQFKQIGERFKSVDLALIPIGAYSPRWFMRASHATPEEAVLIHKEINAKQTIGMHWGTFQLTSEPMLEPPVRFKHAANEAGLSDQAMSVMGIGEIRLINPITQSTSQ